jgi:hypothetical protein
MLVKLECSTHHDWNASAASVLNGLQQEREVCWAGSSSTQREAWGGDVL